MKLRSAKSCFFLIFLILSLNGCNKPAMESYAAALESSSTEGMIDLAKQGQDPWNREALIYLDQQGQDLEWALDVSKGLYRRGDRDRRFLQLFAKQLYRADELELLQESPDISSLYLLISHANRLNRQDLLDLSDQDFALAAELQELRPAILENPLDMEILELGGAIIEGQLHRAAVAYENILLNDQSLAFHGDLLYRFWYGLAAQENWEQIIEEYLNHNSSYSEEFAFGLGRVYRYHGRYDRAAELFLQGPSGDRSRWYYQDCLLRSGRSLAAAMALAEYLPQADSLEYFEDQLDGVLHPLVAQRRWSLIGELCETFLQRDDHDPVAAHYSWVYARLIHHGMAEAGSMDLVQLYRYAMEADPQGWYGSLSAWTLGESGYRWNMADLDDSLVMQYQTALNDSKNELWQSPEGVFLSLYYRGETQLALEYYGANRDYLSGEITSLAARHFHGNEEHYDGIKIALRADPQEEYHGSRTYLRHVYPRGYSQAVDQWASYYQLDPWLVSGLIRVESAYDPRIVSSSGAVGLGQLMAPTAEEQAGKLGLSSYDLEDPNDNLQLMGAYILWLFERPYVENSMDMLFAYNGGPGNLRSWKNQWGSWPVELFWERIPIEQTREYGPKVFTAALYYSYLYQDRQPQESLELWLNDILAD